MASEYIFYDPLVNNDNANCFFFVILYNHFFRLSLPSNLFFDINIHIGCSSTLTNNGNIYIIFNLRYI